MSRKRTLAAIAGSALDHVTGGAGNADSPEARAACTPDALRLCLSEIRASKNISAAKENVGACLARNLDKLSPACRKFIDDGGG